MASASGQRTTRGTLLAAATQVVRAAGVTGLTLDAVARAAGVSKGGLLYHFASKDALIASLVEDQFARCDEAIERAMAADPDQGPGCWLRAYVGLSLMPPSGEFSLTAALLAATTNPALLAPVRAAFARWQARAVADGFDPAEATTIRLAADGLWFAEIVEAGPPPAALRASVVAAMLRRARERDSGPGDDTPEQEGDKDEAR